MKKNLFAVSVLVAAMLGLSAQAHAESKTGYFSGVTVGNGGWSESSTSGIKFGKLVQVDAAYATAIEANYNMVGIPGEAALGIGATIHAVGLSEAAKLPATFIAKVGVERNVATQVASPIFEMGFEKDLGKGVVVDVRGHVQPNSGNQFVDNRFQVGLSVFY